MDKLLQLSTWENVEQLTHSPRAVHQPESKDTMAPSWGAPVSTGSPAAAASRSSKLPEPGNQLSDG